MALYFAQARPGAPIKVGVSVTPSLRVAAIPCPLTGERLRILAEVEPPPDPLWPGFYNRHGDLNAERRVHHRFRDRALPFQASRRVRDGAYKPQAREGRKFEWFVPSPELLDLIEHARRHGALPP